MKRALALGTAIAATVCTSACGAALLSAKAAGKHDVAVTREYLRARWAHERHAQSQMGSTAAAARRAVDKILSGCAGTLTHAPHAREGALSKLGLEAIGAVWSSMLRSERRAVDSYARRALTLKWSKRSVTELVETTTRAEVAEVSQAIPLVCKDVKAWTASGYRHLPAKTEKLNATGPGAFGASNEEVRPYNLVDPQHSGGAEILRHIRVYEDRQDSELARLVGRSEVEWATRYRDILAHANARLSRGLGLASK